MMLSSQFAQLVIGSGAAIQPLDPIQRIRMLAALGIILVLGALLILFIRLAGRTARWYGRDANRRPRWTPRSIASQDGMVPEDRDLSDRANS